jgi:hypothetical protein
MQTREKKRGYTQLIWTVLSIINLKQKKSPACVCRALI